MNKSKLLVLVAIAALVTAFFAFDLKQYVTLEYFQARKDVFEHVELSAAAHSLAQCGELLADHPQIVHVSASVGRAPCTSRFRRTFSTTRST